MVGAKEIVPGDGLGDGAGEVTPICRTPLCPVPPMFVTVNAVVPESVGVRTKLPVPLDVVNPETEAIPATLGDGVLNVPVKFVSEIAIVVGEAVALRNW